MRATPKPTGRSRCGAVASTTSGCRQAASTEAFARIRERLVRTGAGDGTVTADGDRDGLYLSIVEFDSYETAMENSNRPEVSEYAGRLTKLCDTRPKFYNLDVRET